MCLNWKLCLSLFEEHVSEIKRVVSPEVIMKEKEGGKSKQCFSLFKPSESVSEIET